MIIAGTQGPVEHLCAGRPQGLADPIWIGLWAGPQVRAQLVPTFGPCFLAWSARGRKGGPSRRSSLERPAELVAERLAERLAELVAEYRPALLASTGRILDDARVRGSGTRGSVRPGAGAFLRRYGRRLCSRGSFRGLRRLRLAWVGCVGCVGCIGCIGCIGCVGCVGCVGWRR